jgi:hypothetical protein
MQNIRTFALMLKSLADVMIYALAVQTAPLNVQTMFETIFRLKNEYTKQQT